MALSFAIEPVEGAPPRLHVVHLGPELEPATRETLQRALSSKLEGRIDLVTTALSNQQLRRTPRSNDLEFVSRLAALAEQSRAINATKLCLTRPDSTTALSEADARLGKEIERLLAGHPRVETTIGTEFMVQLRRDRCEEAPRAVVPTSGGTSVVPSGSAEPN